jgi:glutaredoxin 3
MAPPTVTMYATGWCPYCERARALLTSKGVSWTEIDVESAGRAEMIERSGGARSVPQIFIGARHIGGSDELHELDQRGELDALLGARQAG